MKTYNKLTSLLLAFALTLGVISQMAVPAFAASNNHEIHVSEKNSSLDADTKQKVDKALTKLDSDLAKLGVPIPKHHHCQMFENLDEQTKNKAKEIMKQMKNGSITKEDGLAKLKQLGITLPKHHPKDDIFSKLDEQTKTKVKEIFTKVKDGMITKEEADQQLKALGVTLPKHHDKRKFKQLDADTKAKAKKLIEDAKVQINKLGADFPSRKYDHLIK